MRETVALHHIQVSAVLDVMGEASAKAQGLKTAITSGNHPSFQASMALRVDCQV